MPKFDCRFPDYDSDWKQVEVPYGDAGDAAEKACEDAMRVWLWECSPPFKVEVRCADGVVDHYVVDVEYTPTFWAHRD